MVMLLTTKDIRYCFKGAWLGGEYKLLLDLIWQTIKFFLFWPYYLLFNY